MTKEEIFHRQHRDIKRSAIVAGCPSAKAKFSSHHESPHLRHITTLFKHKRQRRITVPAAADDG
jgi:hypothetical protein